MSTPLASELRQVKRILLTCVLTATAAFAADKPRIIVVPLAGQDAASSGAAAKFTGLLNDELKANEAIEWAPALFTKAAGAAPAATQTNSGSAAAAAEGAKTLAEGKKAFDDLRFEEAAPLLQKGLAAVLADPATTDFEAVFDGYVKLAAANLRMGEEKGAKTALIDLARLAPNYPLPPGYPPVFQREFEKAHKRLEKLPRGQVSIEGPTGSTAFLDGRDLGMVPATEEGVVQGIHYVKVEGGRGQVFGQVVDVKGAMVSVKASYGTAAVVRAPVNVAEDPKVGPVFDGAMLGRVAAYAKAAGADFVLVGTVSKSSDSQLTAYTGLYSAKKNAVSLLTPTAFDTEVLTANTEAYKLAQEAAWRTTKFQPENVPFALGPRPSGTVLVTQNDVPRSVKTGDDVETQGPERKVVLTPQNGDRVIRARNAVIDVDKPVDNDAPPEEVKPGVPTWVWVVTGVVAAAGAGVGGYFAYTAATKPVTGSLTATW